MPDPPQTDFVTRYIFENPWPGVIVLLIVAIAFGYTGLQRGEMGKVRIAGVGLLLGIVLYVTSALITTPGEHARAVTRSFVSAVVQSDMTTAFGLLSPNAAMAFGAPSNPGMDVNFLQSQLMQLQGAYRIDQNTITQLNAYTDGPNRGIVHLGCLTTLEAGWGGPNRSRWVLAIEQQPDDTWKITRITAVEINGRTPDLSIFR